MKKHFISINTRFITLLALCTIAPMLIFSFYFYSYERSRALEQYRRESEINMSVAIKNIEYYISTCVSSARTVYSNPDLHNILLKGSPQDFVSQEFTEPGPRSLNIPTLPSNRSIPCRRTVTEPTILQEVSIRRRSLRYGSPFTASRQRNSCSASFPLICRLRLSTITAVLPIKKGNSSVSLIPMEK